MNLTLKGQEYELDLGWKEPLQEISKIANAKVYLSENDYQILLENNLVLDDIEYNIYP